MAIPIGIAAITSLAAAFLAPIGLFLVQAIEMWSIIGSFFFAFFSLHFVIGITFICSIIPNIMGVCILVLLRLYGYLESSSYSVFIRLLFYIAYGTCIFWLSTFVLSIFEERAWEPQQWGEWYIRFLPTMTIAGLLNFKLVGKKFISKKSS